MAAYTTIDNPELFFQCKLYSGSSSDVTVTFDGSEDMQPDVVWLKKRNSSGDHLIYDSVRGTNKRLQPNASDAEVDRSSDNDELKSFNSDGWTLGTFNSNVTGSGSTNVSWNWKAGTAWSNDASATSVGSLDSSGSKSATAGFSIISFTGTESGTPSIAHSLSSTPEFIMSRPREVSDNWMVHHGSFSAQDYMILNTTAAKASASSVWNSLPSSTVINMGDNAGVNDDGAMIMYAWHGVQGFSKFGSYTGNGNADGPFIFLGFRPAWIMFKRTDSTVDWTIYDNKRIGYNPNNYKLRPNLSNAEYSTSGYFEADIVSNGFKIKTSDAEVNASGTYIYAAFAEAPFVNSNGVPCNAR